MRFTIEHVVGIERIAVLPGCEELNGELVGQVLEEAGRFASGVLAPLDRVGDRQGCVWQDGEVRAASGFADAYRRYAVAGWTALAAPVEYGGQGLPQLLASAADEIWSSANLSFSLAPMLASALTVALVRHASEAQRARWLPKLVSGEWTGAMDLTEPQAGSDLAAIRCRAVAHGDHYRLHGTKIFITWGEHDLAANIVHLVLARLPDAPPGVKGISLFIVPRNLPDAHGGAGARNDLRCLSIEHKLGIRGSPTAVMSFGEGEGAVGWLVGEPHRGLEYMFTMMNHARLGVGIQGVGLAEHAWQRALAFARGRVQGRAPGGAAAVAIAEHADVRRMLLSMRVRTEAMRALAYEAAAQLDLAHRHPDGAQRRAALLRAELLTPVVKGWCTEQAVQIASTGLQVHGGMGYVEETGAAQLLRDSRITPIYEGTTGIQANDLLMRKLVRDGGAAFGALVAELGTVAATARRSAEPRCAVLGVALADAVALLEDCGRTLIERAARDPRAALAGAVPMLELCGTVAGAAMAARAALAAVAVRPACRERWLDSAAFQADHELPLAHALAARIRAGAGSVLSAALD
jgi:alkylation response protein AidB-like acyl-CoA dehydrogenase